MRILLIIKIKRKNHFFDIFVCHSKIMVIKRKKIIAPVSGSRKTRIDGNKKIIITFMINFSSSLRLKKYLLVQNEAKKREYDSFISSLG